MSVGEGDSSVRAGPEPVDPASRATGAISTAVPDEPGLLVQTTVEVLDGGPILEVAHTTRGCWHLCGLAHLTRHGARDTSTRPGSTIPAVASWALLEARDPSLAQVAGLPPAGPPDGTQPSAPGGAVPPRALTRWQPAVAHRRSRTIPPTPRAAHRSGAAGAGRHRALIGPSRRAGPSVPTSCRRGRSDLEDLGVGDVAGHEPGADGRPARRLVSGPAGRRGAPAREPLEVA